LRKQGLSTGDQRVQLVHKNSGNEKTKKGLKLCSPNPFTRGWLTLVDQAANLALT